MSRILIAGCGYIGSELARRLAAEGHEVFGLRRNISELPSGVHPIQADLLNPATLEAIPPELDCVYYTAAASGFNEDAYREIYITGLDNLLARLERQERLPGRFIYTSSTSVYGQTDGEWVDEDSPAEPVSFAGEYVLKGEQRVRKSPLTGIVLRLGGIYGPGRTRTIQMLREGKATASDGSHFLNHIHRDDAVGALIHLMTVPDPAPIYVGVDEDPASRNVIYAWLAEQLGLEPPLESAREDLEVRRRGGNKRVRSERLRDSGYRFRYPTFREGYASLI